MAIENIQEIKDYMIANKDNEEVKGYVKGFTDLNGVKNFLETSEDGKQYMNNYSDSKVTKGIESYKTNNFDKDYTDRFNRENPTADPLEIAKNKKVSDLEAMVAKMQNDSIKEKMTTKALKTLQGKSLPTDLSDLLIGADETSTTANIDLFSAMLAKHDEDLKKTLVGSNTYVPPGDQTKDLTDKEKLRLEVRASMGIKEKN